MCSEPSRVSQYCEGVYYLDRGRDYLVVMPLAGFVVPTVPDDHETVVVNGVRYLWYNGVYYQRHPQGYLVVEPPPGSGPHDR